MTDPTPQPPAAVAPPAAPLPPPPSGPASPPATPAELTPEEQMALFEQELKETDWGHQPC